MLVLVLVPAMSAASIAAVTRSSVCCALSKMSAAYAL